MLITKTRATVEIFWLNSVEIWLLPPFHSLRCCCRTPLQLRWALPHCPPRGAVPRLVGDGECAERSREHGQQCVPSRVCSAGHHVLNYQMK